MDEASERKPTPIFTYLLMALMVFLQVYLSLLPSASALHIFETYSLIPVRLLDGVFLDSIVSYIFMHGNWVHLFVNVIALLGAGIIVEKNIGHLRFLILFMVSGVLAGIAHCFLNPQSSVPLIGSSGAIFSIIAVLFLFMPFKLTYALVVPLPSVVVGLMLVLVESSAIWIANDIAIAHDAHIMGFLTGCVYAFITDKSRALKGLIVAAAILVLMYFISLYFGVPLRTFKG
jgi:membrane associated rhomboid family serine protease